MEHVRCKYTRWSIKCIVDGVHTQFAYCPKHLALPNRLQKLLPSYLNQDLKNELGLGFYPACRERKIFQAEKIIIAKAQRCERNWSSPEGVGLSATPVLTAS